MPLEALKPFPSALVETEALALLRQQDWLIYVQSPPLPLISQISQFMTIDCQLAVMNSSGGTQFTYFSHNLYTQKRQSLCFEPWSLSVPV